MKKVQCATCRFFTGGTVDGTISLGFCRRRCPVILPFPAPLMRTGVYLKPTAWPPVYPSDWCGEHKHKTRIDDIKRKP